MKMDGLKIEQSKIPYNNIEKGFKKEKNWNKN